MVDRTQSIKFLEDQISNEEERLKSGNLSSVDRTICEERIVVLKMNLKQRFK